MDVFIEKLIAKKPTVSDILKIALISLATFVLDVLAIVLFLPIVPIVVVGTAVLAWYLITNISTEYEYILTNGELDVDKILAQRKRTRLVSVSAKEFEYIKKLTDRTRHEYENLQVNKKIIATDNKEFDNIYYAVFNHKTFGKTMLCFQPDERMLEQFQNLLQEKYV